MQRIIILFSILLVFTGKTALAQLPDFCLTTEEYHLYTLINDFRTNNGLGIIPISRSLSYVAKVHARDLYLNNPDTSICSLNSWSDKGQWTACCHSGATPAPVCIVNKPKELTKYPGEGHEIAHWDSEGLVPDTILHFWKSVEATKELLLNQKRWSDFSWKAIGIGLYQGYACVWVGDQIDIEPEPTLCTTTNGGDNLAFPYKTVANEVVSKPTGRFYIIFGSFNTQEDAEKMVAKYRKDGFPDAKIMVNDQKTFRVSLNDFTTQQEALDAKSKLGNGYKDAWITKY